MTRMIAKIFSRLFFGEESHEEAMEGINKMLNRRGRHARLRRRQIPLPDGKKEISLP